MPDDRPRLKFLTAIIADDIRREANGKEIFVGVYTARMVFAALVPEMGVIIAISVIFTTPSAGNIPITIRVLSPSEQPPTEIKGIIGVPEDNPSIIGSASLSGIPIAIAQTGDIIVQVKNYDDEEWETVRTLPVVIDPSDPGIRADNVTRMASIAPAQPSQQPAPAPPESSSLPSPSRPARPTRRRRT